MSLLAKSGNPKRNEEGRSLTEHIEDCLLIWRYLKECFPSITTLESINIDYWQLLRLCVIFHDLGKAHGEFQRLLRDQENEWNSQRHELFSIPFIDAISRLEEEILQLMRLVVAGHHKDIESLRQYLEYYESDSFGLTTLEEEERENFEAAFQKHVDIKAVVSILQGLSVNINNVVPKSLNSLIHGYIRNPHRLEKPDAIKLTLLFGGLKWCDHLGSALVREISQLEESDFDFLSIQQAELQSNGQNFYQHQIDCANQQGNVILTAPTGSGKTESAFLWLKNQIKAKGQGRAFYILPFTASINAMYDRLSTVIGNGKVGMLHGKLRDYLNNYFEDLQYDVSAKKEEIRSIKDKYKSLAVPVKVITPFQLLKHLFGLKGYEQGIFEMVGSYLIFDEIHAYRPDVFAQIKILLEFATKQLNAHAMIMTATMPNFLRSKLENSVDQFVPIKASPQLYEQFKRHQINLRKGKLLDSVEEIKKTLRAGKKALVVCNTIKHAQKVFQELSHAIDKDQAILLHGAFTGKDRSEIEKQLQNEHIKLLVGTQAIEVSLDIDYDIIFTEPAPIDALIQRFGRVNRRRKKGISPCIVFGEGNDDDKYIYKPEVINKTIKALEKIENENQGIIDESLLQQAIDFVYNGWDKEDEALFLDTYNYMKDALALLAPMQKNRYSEEDFYKQFDGIKILPQCNRSTFEAHLEAFDFINAESLKVQISKRRFMGWLKNQNLKKQVYAFGHANKINTVIYYETNKRYNRTLGLIADEEEPWKEIVEIL